MQEQLHLQDMKFGPIVNSLIEEDPKQLRDFITYAMSKVKTIDLTQDSE